MQDAPGYFDVIKEPIDLKLVGARIKDKYYNTREAFIRDVNKMFDNCRKYNEESSEYYQCAEQLQAYFR